MEATLVPKRLREEAQVVKDLDFEEDYSKRHKPYTHIISLLDSEEDESTQDLSPLMTTLQQEINCCASSNTNSDTPKQENDQDTPTTNSSSISQVLEEEEEESDKERVMRHLLQASDDELGIPSSGDGLLLGFGDDGINSSGDLFSSLCDKLWELEDERANYSALLQSELFL
ncbi:hypothetical protein RJT34_06760 [Clitoria ternatea]|uniref:Uncharacterized protein n=1 Tax=Clitoria ternatea TaxID=43366 RepID=A0AAN9PTQ2_CLITE